MNENSIRNKTLSGLIWRYIERFSVEIVHFVVSIILARILHPSDYGLIGLITVFIAIANIFITNGLPQALVQRKEISNLDFSTVFYYNIVFSVVIYGILFFSAPFIAQFYNESRLTSIIRVLSLTIIVGGINSVQLAYVQKTMQFRKSFLSSLGGIFIAATVACIMAYLGYGVWALVAQQITTVVINTIILWFTVKWRPDNSFSLSKMKTLFSFGGKLLFSGLLETVYSNIYSLIIGKFYSASDLGYYNRGKQFPMLVINNINTTIDNVLFPVLSEVQEQKERLKSMMRRSLVTSIFLIFPAMAGLAAVAEPLTVTLLTEKWLPAVPFIQFCCFTYAFWPVHTANLQAIKALGRSDIFLKLEIIKKVIGIAILVITLPYGLTVMMVGRCVSAVISSFINAYPNKKLLGYSYWEQLKDMAPSFLLSLVMAVAILPVTLLQIHPLLQMIIQIGIGVCVYFGLAKLFRLECLEYLINTVKGFLRKKNDK